MRYAVRLALLLLSVAVAGCAGGPPRRTGMPREPEWRAPVEILQKYADKDGNLTREQLEAGLRRDFEAADLNHNGVLDPDEVRAVNEKRWDDDHSAISPLQDWNGDGVVDFKEFAATPWALFNDFDLDHNGVLTAKELHLASPGAPGQPGKTEPERRPHEDRHQGPDRGGEPQQ